MADEAWSSHVFLRHETLTKLPNDREPRPQDIQTLKKEVCENLKGIYTARGGGAHGHLALVMTDADYRAISINNVPFEIPIHPGDSPQHAPNATEFEMQETYQKFDAEIRDFHLYWKVQLIIKIQILEAVPKRFTEILDDMEEGYSNVTIMQLMNHLISTYGTITLWDLAENLNELDREWDPDTGIMTLFRTQRKVQQFALLGNDPISDMTLLIKAIRAVRNTGLFETEFFTFDRRPLAEQTYTNFKTDFLLADQRRRAKRATTANNNTGYHNANVPKSTVSETTNRHNGRLQLLLVTWAGAPPLHDQSTLRPYQPNLQAPSQRTRKRSNATEHVWGKQCYPTPTKRKIRIPTRRTQKKKEDKPEPMIKCTKICIFSF